jgi:DNA-binding FadR family transcriptional regulator
MNGPAPSLEQMTVTSHERATPSLVYRALLRSIRSGSMVPGGKLPNERDLAVQLHTSRTAVRQALAMMEREGLVHRRVGAGTFLTDDADQVFDRLDQTEIGTHDTVPTLAEIVEARLLFEPGMMHLVVGRADAEDFAAMRQQLQAILDAPTWRDFKESIYALHRQIVEATRNRFLMQVFATVLTDRREVQFDGRGIERPAPLPVRQQTHGDLAEVVDALEARDARRAERLIGDYLTRMLAIINI